MNNTGSRAAPMAELRLLDVHSAEFAADPHRMLRPLRGVDAVRSNRGLEVLSYEAAAEVLTDPALAVGFEEMLHACGIFDGPAYASLSANISNVEGDLHARQRRVIAPFFRPGRVELLRAGLRQRLERRFAEVSAQATCDIVDLVGEWLPATTVCLIVGAPLTDRPFINRMSDEVQRFFSMHPAQRQTVEAAFDELAAYVNNLIERRRSEPGDDLVSFLLAAEARSELAAGEVRDLVIFITLAGTQTTNTQIACMFKAFAEHPDQWAELRSDEELIPPAVIEASRMHTSVPAMPRVAREEREVAGVAVPAGTHIFVNFIAANRDPAVFASPDEMNIRRSMARPPLNWSVGRHFCPGRPIAVLELEETLRAAARHWRSFEGEFESHGAPYVVRPERLTLSFDTGAPRAHAGETA